MKSAWMLATGTLFVAALALAPSAQAAGSWDTCAGCHEALVKDFAATPHAHSPAGCEGCHGPSDEHVAGMGDKSKIKQLSKLAGSERADVCLQCHEKGKVLNWAGSSHASHKLDCGSCHNPHPKGVAPKKLLAKSQMDTCGSCHPTQRGKMFRSAHMPVREGKMECSSCHNPHGTLGEKMLPQASVNENCYSCHAEKRGPVLWEHAAVVESCSNCHDPHGSMVPSMLKVKQPVLCQSCHGISRHPSQAHLFNDRRAFGHACLNCHPMIHGSNHPSGNYFTR